MPFNIYRKIIRNIKEDGMVVSSSGYLVRTMVGKIDFSHPQRILEVGSGKGVFTREIINRMHPESELHVSDIKRGYNPWIKRMITENPARSITLYNECVTQMLQHPEYYDVIVSSLPLKNFECREDSNAFLHKVIECLKYSLKVGGMYLQYQYFLSNKDDIEKIFGKTMDEISFVPLNLLPAFIYSMTI